MATPMSRQSEQPKSQTHVADIKRTQAGQVAYHNGRRTLCMQCKMGQLQSLTGAQASAVATSKLTNQQVKLAPHVPLFKPAAY